MKRTIKTLVAAGVVGSTAVLAGAYFGVVNVGGDDPHFPAVHAFLTMARDRSIEVRSRDIEVPNLDDQALIRAGAGNYNSMCIGCHLAPGVAETELSQSLYPAPPQPRQDRCRWQSVSSVLGDQAWHQGNGYACVGQEHGRRVHLGHGCLPQPTADDGCQAIPNTRRIQWRPSARWWGNADA